jgi:serine/threonine-protein kinase RsbW
MHAREMLEAGYGFVRASADSVLYDWVRTTYRREIAGASRPLAGEHLLAEKLKQSYDLMMSRYRRRVEAQLVQSLSSFDFQSVPASLLDQSRFEKSYRGLSPVQMRRSLDEEQDRVRLPQIVLVSDLGSGSEGEISWRLLTARGFEGGIYSDSSEVLWLIAMLSSREPVGMEVLGRIDQKLNAAMARTARPTRTARWYISKEGVSASLAEHLSINRVYCSTYAQLDLLQDYLIKLEAPAPARRPASEFELVIPIENEAELIAARTAEQIARAADFEQEAINQIKTALIEACINAAEHSDSPDRRIHQRFALSEDRLVITVSNKGRSFGPAQAQMAVGAGFRGSRGRGLQIIRALMDEVHVVPTDGGASLVMTKFLKRPEGHTES